MSDVLQAIYRGDRGEAERQAAGRELDIFEASALGRTERVRELLDADPSLVNRYGEDGFHPVGLASFFGHLETARLLYEHGADPNHEQGGGFRAIDAARQNGDARVEQLLLDHGATGSDPTRAGA